MFGQNPIAKKNYGDGQHLHIVKGSPFYTIQGEGPHAGRPAVFIRLHGCNLRCWFCDTDFSSKGDPHPHTLDIIDEIGQMWDGWDNSLVVVTGGEPMLQNIYPLCYMLNRAGCKVQIETAGTLWLDGINQVADIVVSPKTRRIHRFIYQHAVAFKYIISASSEFEKFVPVTRTQEAAKLAVKLASPRPDAPVYLSPMDEYDPEKNAANIAKVSELALKYGVNAGLQMHKILGLD